MLFGLFLLWFTIYFNRHEFARKSEFLYYRIMQMQQIVKIQSKGNLTIPKSLRDALGFVENELVRMKKEKGRLIVEAVRTLSYPVRAYKDKELKGFFDLDEKETKKLKAKGLL